MASVKYSIRQAFVGVLVGALFGPMIGSLSGAFGAPLGIGICQVLGVSVTKYIGWKAPAAGGMLFGGVIGLPLGLSVSPFIRVMAKALWPSQFTLTTASIIGIIQALCCGAIILYCWYPPWESWVMVAIEAIAVGWGTAAIALFAKPAWAPD